MEGEKTSKKYWVALAVDNSIPRPDPDPATGFLPMYFNASPLLVPTDEGADALCIFSTEGRAIGYLREAEEQASVVPAMQLPVPARREDFRELLAHYPTSYIAVDPEHGVTEDAFVAVDEFLAGLEE